MPVFFFFIHFVPLSFKVVFVDLLFEKVKQYQVLYDKQIKGHREKDFVRNAWNARARALEFI